MRRIVSLATMLACMLLLCERDTFASLVLPDAEFSFSAPVQDAKEATDAIAEALVPLGFKIKRQPRVRDNGFFRAEFERPPLTSVSLSGRVSCVHVGIYTSLSHTPKTAEAIKLEAVEIYDHLLASLRVASPSVFLFKSSGGSGGCEHVL